MTFKSVLSRVNKSFQTFLDFLRMYGCMYLMSHSALKLEREDLGVVGSNQCNNRMTINEEINEGTPA